MRKLIAFCALALVLFCGVARADVVATASSGVGETTASQVSMSGVTCVTVDWLSSSTGICTAVLSDVYGQIQRVTINPGVTSPTAAYDMTLADADGWDVLGGQGADLSSTVTTSVACCVGSSTVGLVPVAACGNLTLAITNAGASKVGAIRLYLKP